MSRLWCFLKYCITASSSSLPPTRIDSSTTIPLRAITAISVVPPPMSTIMLPTGSATESPIPMAAAIGSSINMTCLAPAFWAASLTARRSTSVIPEGTQITIRPIDDIQPGLTRRIRPRMSASATEKSAMTPSLSGRIVSMSLVRPLVHQERLLADRDRLVAPAVARDDRRLVEHDPLVADVDEGVGGAEVDGDVDRERVEHGAGRWRDRTRTEGRE